MNATLRGPSEKEWGALGDHEEGRVADTGEGRGTGKREETKGGWLDPTECEGLTKRLVFA